MEQMEYAIKELFTKNESLIAECKALRDTNEKLLVENTELKNRLSAPCVNCIQNRSVECDGQRGSAESLKSDLPPKGLSTHSAAALEATAMVALWKILLACLLYQTSSTNSQTQKSTLSLWNDSHRASLKISPEIWKQLLRKQVLK